MILAEFPGAETLLPSKAAPTSTSPSEGVARRDDGRGAARPDPPSRPGGGPPPPRGRDPPEEDDDGGPYGRSGGGARQVADSLEWEHY